MNKFTYSCIIIAAACIGLIFHAYQKEWIILQLPSRTQIQVEVSPQTPQNAYMQQKITLFFFKHEAWHSEHNFVIWSSDPAENVKTLVNNWLTLLEDEKIIDTDIQLGSAIITANKELCLSFTKDLFDPQAATFAKLMIIESLLKTLREHKIPAQNVRFLVHHQTMNDDHLNFTLAWPMTGYMATT